MERVEGREESQEGWRSFSNHGAICRLHPTGRETERMGGWKEDGRTYISH